MPRVACLLSSIQACTSTTEASLSLDSHRGFPVVFAGMNELLASLLDARQTVNPVLACLRAAEHRNCSRKRTHDELYSEANVETLYGKVTDGLQVRLSDGTSVPIDYISPTALLVESAKKSLPFFCLMQQCVATAPKGILRLVLYHDGVTPGNVHSLTSAITL